MKPLTVRALYRVVTVSGVAAPYNSLSLKLHYPCRHGRSVEERSIEEIPADVSRAPFPVVIILPGKSIPHECYGWLARVLAEAGLVAVTYNWITEKHRGDIGLTPGVHRKRLTRSRYGKKPSCEAIEPILGELRRINKQKEGPLAGQLNLSRIVLGGHAAGGAMALMNARIDWFPGLRGAFSYAGHSLADPELDWDDDEVMPLSRDLPLLLMGGSRDGILGREQQKYPGSAAIERTFQAGIKGKRGDRYLLIVEGANHSSLAWPLDLASSCLFLDKSSRGGNKRIRKYLGQVILNFCDHVCTGNAMSAADFQGLCSNHKLSAISDHK